MNTYMKIALLLGVSLGSSVFAYRYTIKVNPSVKDKGGNLTYTKSAVMGGHEPETLPVADWNTKPPYETAGVCMWQSSFLLDSGPFAGEKITVSHDPNACTSRTLTLGVKEDFAGMDGVTVGPKGKLAVRIQ